MDFKHTTPQQKTYFWIICLVTSTVGAYTDRIFKESKNGNLYGFYKPKS